MKVEEINCAPGRDKRITNLSFLCKNKKKFSFKRYKKLGLVFGETENREKVAVLSLSLHNGKIHLAMGLQQNLFDSFPNRLLVQLQNKMKISYLQEQRENVPVTGAREGTRALGKKLRNVQCGAK